MVRSFGFGMFLSSAQIFSSAETFPSQKDCYLPVAIFCLCRLADNFLLWEFVEKSPSEPAVASIKRVNE
ncbi:MAG: hypothetical protein ACO2PL_17340 [Armatimonadota bacterium]